MKEIFKKIYDSVIGYKSGFMELMRIIFHYVKNEKEIISYVSRTVLHKLLVYHLNSEKQKAVLGSPDNDDSVAFEHMRKVCLLLKTVLSNSREE